MAIKEFKSKFFSIQKITKNLNLYQFLNCNQENTQEKDIITYNQLMKADEKIKYIFVFDENAIEIPSLVTYARHFNINIFRISDQDIKNIQNIFKHARIFCVRENNLKCKEIDERIKKSNMKETEININNIQNLSI